MKKVYGNNLKYSEYSSVDGGYCIYSVYGEDPNCDMGGHHSNPFLGNVEGTFKEVLEYAANEMPRFYQWGGGGHIKPFKKLRESADPVVLNPAKKLKLSRKTKLNNLVAADIENLIDIFESMSNEEIKVALEGIKEKIINKKREI